jgi:hypothetical protein
MADKKRPLIEMDTKFENVPKTWLDIVEPRITRPKNSTCWIWGGACDKNGEPVVNYNNPDTGKRNTRLVKRIVADLFWAIRKGIEVIHHCGTMKCLNPAHFYLSSKHYRQEDRPGMIKVRQKRLQRYVEKGS